MGKRDKQVPTHTTRTAMINYTAAEVETRNRVNAETSRIREEASKILAPYQGSKILKGISTGTTGWIAKLSPQLNSLGRPGFRVSFSFGHSMVWLCVDATYPVSGGGVKYVKREAYVCSLIERDTMDPTSYAYESIRTDYTVEEVTLVRTRITETQEQLDRLKSQIREFGNY